MMNKRLRRIAAVRSAIIDLTEVDCPGKRLVSLWGRIRKSDCLEKVVLGGAEGNGQCDETSRGILVIGGGVAGMAVAADAGSSIFGMLSLVVLISILRSQGLL